MSTALQHQIELEAHGLPVGQQLVLLFLLKNSKDPLAKKVTPRLQRESGISKLTRVGAGYAHTEYNKKEPIGKVHFVVTLNRLQERKLVRLFVIVGTDGREGEASLSADGAWVVRTLNRTMENMNE